VSGTTRPADSIECVMCGGAGFLVNVTAAVEEAIGRGYQVATIDNGVVSVDALTDAMVDSFDPTRETSRETWRSRAGMLDRRPPPCRQGG
jgi:hypothetical protein